MFGKIVEIVFFKKNIFKINFLIYSDYFDVLISKIIF